jgi:hypothetical protein
MPKTESVSRREGGRTGELMSNRPQKKIPLCSNVELVLSAALMIELAVIGPAD